MPPSFPNTNVKSVASWSNYSGTIAGRPIGVYCIPQGGTDASVLRSHADAVRAIVRYCFTQNPPAGHPVARERVVVLEDHRARERGPRPGRLDLHREDPAGALLGGLPRRARRRASRPCSSRAARRSPRSTGASRTMCAWRSRPRAPATGTVWRAASRPARMGRPCASARFTTRCSASIWSSARTRPSSCSPPPPRSEGMRRRPGCRIRRASPPRPSRTTRRSGPRSSRSARSASSSGWSWRPCRSTG